MLKSKKNPQGRKRANDVYLLTGKLFCGICKSHMVGMSGTSRNGKKHCYYVCNEKRSGGSCNKKAVRRDYIEKEIAKAIQQYILRKDVTAWIIDQVLSFQKADERQQEIANMVNRQKEVKKSIANVMLAIDQGIITESTKAHLLELESEKGLLDAKITVAQAEAGKAVTKDALAAYLEHFRYSDTDNKDCQKELFDAFIKAIYLYDDHVTLTFDINNGTTEDVEINIDDIEESWNNNVRLKSNVAHQKHRMNYCGVFYLLQHISNLLQYLQR